MFEKLGRFEIKGLLGRGAMGEVYLGFDPTLGREVAIKTILASSAQAEEAKQRFEREARAAGVLNHPNIVTIYEFGEDQGVLYIAMERVKGQDLEEMLRQRSLTPGEALEVLAQVCDGLDLAHRNQIIHRDIKPSNVRVLRDGRRMQAKVMDFGVARLKGSDMTATGMVVGTVSYMAPEYIRTGNPDARSDLFAIGVMLYECISGRKPFEGDTTPTILYKIVNEAPDPIELSHLREISPAIRMVLDRALAKDPDQRYQTAEMLAQALRAAKDPTWQGRVAETTAQVVQRSRSSIEPAPPMKYPEAPTAVLAHATPHRRSSVAILLLSASVLGLGAFGFGGYAFYKWRQRHPSKPKADPAAPIVKPVFKPLQSEPSLPEPPVTLPEPEVTPVVPEEKAAVKPTPKPVEKPIEKPADKPVERPAKEKPPEPVKRPNPVETRPGKTTPAPETTLPDPNIGPADSSVPQPPSVAGPPSAERRNNAQVTLSEGIQLADSNPEKAIGLLRQSLNADPSNPQAYAWLVATLYNQEHYREIPAVLARARQHGIPRARLMANMRFRMVMQKDKLERRIPGNPGGEE